MTKPQITKWDDKLLKSRGNYTITITPDLATRLLELNTRNRAPKRASIPRFARDMAAGNWSPDASDLKFSRTGELMDGQNRLMACVLSGASFTTLIRTGLDPAAKDYVDTGTKRTASDMLKINGVTSYTASVSAAVTLWARYEDRVVNHKGKRQANTSGGGRPGQQLTLTHKEILDFLDRHPTILQFAGLADSLRAQVMPAIPPSAILCFLAMAAEKDEKEAVRFAERLINGDYGGSGDPMIALVQYAARVRGNVGVIGSPGHRGRIAQDSHVNAMSRVWNALRAGEKIEGRIQPKITDRLVMPK